MDRIIEVPHLPEGKVRYLIIGEKYKNVLNNAINQLNINVIWSNNNVFVDKRLSGHSDLSLLHLGGEKLAALEYIKDCEIADKLIELGFKIEYCKNPEMPNYPSDVALNMCILGDCVICNPETADTELAVNKEIIRCKQGYTKCSTLVVDEKAIITSDRLIAMNSVQHGIETLLIDDSFVKLQGFDKGFIGGAAFKISRDKIAFTGTIDSIENKNAIESFLHKHRVSTVYLTDEEIFDIGGAIPIIEEI